jgi:hypothetical protein
MRGIAEASVRTRHGRNCALPALAQADEFPANVPVVELLDFLCHRDRYSVPRASLRKPDSLFYPLGRTPRTAVASVPVRESSRVRWFRSLLAGGVWEFSPQAVAAPLDALLMVAAAPGVAKRPLENAVIAFTSILSGPMTPADADRLWSAFEAPVFEQMVGFDGELLAAECEMHQGLHIAGSAAHFELLSGGELLVSFLDNPRLPLLRLDTSLTGDLDCTPCSCGLSSPRLRYLTRRRKTAGEKKAAAGAAG